MKPTKAARKRRAREQTTDIKSHIRGVALALFDEFGYENVTIRKICSEAKVSIETLYDNYVNKQDILLEIFTQVENALSQVPVPPGTSFADEVMLYINAKMEAVVRFHQSYGFQPVFNALQQTEGRNMLLEEREIYPHVLHVVRRGQRAGEVRVDMEAEDIARRLLRLLLGLLFDWILRDCESDLLTLVDAECRLYLELFNLPAPGS